MKEQTVGQLCVRGDGESCPGSAHVGGQRSHDGVVASEAVAVIVVVDYRDFDSHAVEVDHAVNHVGGLSCCDAWEKQSKNSKILYTQYFIQVCILRLHLQTHLNTCADTEMNSRE